jgi:hypothetical protein
MHLSEEAAAHLEEDDILTKGQPCEQMWSRKYTHKQEDTRGYEDLADNVESFTGLVLCDCNADCKSSTTGHAKSKAQDRVEKLLSIYTEQTVERRQE